MGDEIEGSRILREQITAGQNDPLQIWNTGGCEEGTHPGLRGLYTMPLGCRPGPCLVPARCLHEMGPLPLLPPLLAWLLLLGGLIPPELQALPDFETLSSCHTSSTHPASPPREVLQPQPTQDFVICPLARSSLQ